MADNTGIEWAEATWNPIVGCSVVSPGCTNCYAMKMAGRLDAMARADHANPDPQGTPAAHYRGTVRGSKAGAVWSGQLALAPDRILTQPLRWRRPRRIFVNSMGDLFHEDTPEAWIDRVFAVMALAPQHSFMVLTKRSARMRAYLSERLRSPYVCAMALSMVPSRYWGRSPAWYMPWPLPNVWLGVSAEDQPRAAERVPDLLATPAAIRFVSAEPLLGPLNLRRIRIAPDHHTMLDALDGYAIADSISGSGQERAMLDLVIAGGESGPKARPMHPDWARSLRDQCAAAGTAFFFKQWGEWTVAVDRKRDDPDWRLDYSFTFADQPPHTWLNLEGGRGFHGERFHVMRRVGKRAAGRLLDGVEHNALPEART